MPRGSEKGMILFIVIGVILVVAALSTVILRIISNQARLTHHQVSRIQAQYAAKAGVIYALDKLRRHDDSTCWPDSGTYTRIMRPSGAGPCVVLEPALPLSVTQVNITVNDTSDIPGTRKVSATAVFTYTP